MTKTPLACIVLAAGSGTRMKSDLPKVLHPLAGRPMISWILDTASQLGAQKIVVVVGPQGDSIKNAVTPHQTVVQKEQLGTADAVKAALPALKGFEGDVLVLYGDGPLYRAQTLLTLLETMHKDPQADSAFLSMKPEDPTGYGRMVMSPLGGLAKIVEEKDATADERQLTLCWTGVMCAKKSALETWLPKVNNNNAKGEYYLTTLPELMNAAQRRTVVAHSPLDETLGANTRSELALLEARIQNRLRHAAMDNGVTMIDPATVYLSWDTQLGRDVTIEPHVFFGPNVKIADHVRINAFSHLEGAIVAARSVIGPHARLRPGAIIGADSRIGNFVEVKNSTLGEHVKANHHAYIGDAQIGDGVNFSCGAITVNYDGQDKHKTTIGSNAMIGSNVSLVAPITIGEGAYVGAGSTITKDVPADSLAVARQKPSFIEGWAAARRKKKKSA